VHPVSQHVSFLREREDNFVENSEDARGNLFPTEVRRFVKKKREIRVKIIESITC